MKNKIGNTRNLVFEDRIRIGEEKIESLIVEESQIEARMNLQLATSKSDILTFNCKRLESLKQNASDL